MIDFNIFDDISDKPIVNTDEEYVIQQIDLLFNTDKESVLGDISYGTNYDRYLYTVGISNSALESKIMGDLQQLDLRSYEPSVSVQLIEGTVRDIALIDITLKGEYDIETFHKTYKIN